MASKLKDQKVTPKRVPLPSVKLNGTRRKSNGTGNGFDTAAHETGHSGVADAAFIEKPVVDPIAPRAERGATRPNGLIARGKDIISGDAGAAATAAAIVVGAALIEVELLPGLIIGAGAIVLGKMFPELGAYVRPMIKGAVRAGFSLSQKAREVISEANEQVHDLVAEVKHEQKHPDTEAPPGNSKQHSAAGGEMPGR